MDQQLQINITTAQLPEKIHSILQKTGRGGYNIFINSDQTEDERAAAYLHEALHIYHGDADSKTPADIIEQERHAELKRLLQLMARE